MVRAQHDTCGDPHLPHVGGDDHALADAPQEHAVACAIVQRHKLGAAWPTQKSASQLLLPQLGRYTHVLPVLAQSAVGHIQKHFPYAQLDLARFEYQQLACTGTEFFSVGLVRPATVASHHHGENSWTVLAQASA